MYVTTKERLHRLVDRLSEDKAAAVLVLLEDDQVQDTESAELPEFFGMLHSGKRDLAACSSEMLSAELGRR